MVHVLLTNDDGPPGEASPYIQAFVRALRKYTDWEISIAVPHTQRSWVGKAHLINESVYPTYIYVDDETGNIEGPLDRKIVEKSYSEWTLLTGTPASCANIGVHHLFADKGPVDLVLSGPNFGRNSTALYIMSSGTVGAAMEGALCGIKSIAISYAFETREHDLKQIEDASMVSSKLAHHLYNNWDPNIQLYSVNVPIYTPNLPSAKIFYVPILQNQWGTAFESWDIYDETSKPSGAVTPVNAEDETAGIEKIVTDRRKHYRWKPDFDAVNKSVEQAGPNNDGWALAQGHIAVTPLRATFQGVPTNGEIKLNINYEGEKLESKSSKYETTSKTSGVKLSIATNLYEHELWVAALNKNGIKWSVDGEEFQRVFEYGDYDEIDFDRLMQDNGYSACTYVYRKGLIRKHFLANTIDHYTAKNPTSILKTSFPQSFNLECDFAEFLDDSLDEAYELRQELEADTEKLWIVKPGMSDRAQGIRVFKNGVEGLQEVFDELEGDDHEEGGLVNLFRHFIVQKYMANPLLLNGGRKFHIRTYIVASGSIQVYVYEDMLALFAGSTYNKDTTDLEGHLTNTCFQEDIEESDVVFRFNDLDLQNSQKTKIIDQIKETVHDLFAAALADRINFQPLHNALEMYGLDFLVDDNFNVFLLEVNAYPDFKQTGDTLKELVEEFIEGVIDVGVKPLLQGGEPEPKSASGLLSLVYNFNLYK